MQRFFSYLFILYSLVLLSNVLVAQNNQPVTPNLVRTVTCSITPIQNNSSLASNTRTTVTNYNKDGQKTTEINAQQHYAFSYQSNQQECYWMLGNGQKVLQQKEFYNPSGQLIKRTRFRTDGSLLDRLEIAYENGHKKLESYYNDKKIKVYDIKYSHNTQQHSIREVYTNYLTKQKLIGSTDLNQKLSPIQYKQYDMSGPLIQTIDYTYDDKNRLTSKIIQNASNGMTQKIIYQYEKEKTRCSIYNGQTLIEQLVYEYEYY